MLFLFENYRLDTDRRELRRGTAPLSMEPQVFDLLVFLVLNRDRVVTRDDVLASIWGGRIVSDSTLNTRLNAVRRVIGDDGKQQRLIRTIIGRGVHFIGQVHEIDTAGPANTGPITGSHASELPIPDKPSIVVLPFANLSRDPEQECFADGTAEEIITALCRYPTLFVIARDSSFTYKDRIADVARVGRELGVRYVLRGNVRKSDDRIRVTTRLIEAESGKQVWAERYDRPLANIFVLQDEIAEAVSIAIAPAIGAAERQLAIRKSPQNLDAWGMYQRGLWHIGRFSRDDNAVAQRCFNQVTELDPNFSGGYRGLALVTIQGWGIYRTEALEEMLASAEALARRAVELDASDAESHAYHSNILWMCADYEGALAEAQRALELSPNLARGHANLGCALIFSGRTAEGVVTLQKAIRLDPYEPMLPSRLNLVALGYYFAGKYEAAAEAAQRAIHASPNYPLPHRWLAAALGQLGRTLEAKQALDNAIAIAPQVFDRYVRHRVRWHRQEDYAHMVEGLRKAGLIVQ